MRLRRWFPVIAGMGLIMMLCGCDDGCPKPVTGVTISPDQADVEIGHTAGITATVTGGECKDLTWSVNGIENGNEVYGIITRNSRVTYNAPDSLPANTTIVIGAISIEDETKMDTCHIRLSFTKIFVDIASGSDDTGTGCTNIPVRTITRALGIADSGMTVVVQPGIYDWASGEVFPFRIPAGVSLVGMDWETCIISGVPIKDDPVTVWLTRDHTALRKFTIEENEPRATWFPAIYLSASHALVDSIRILQRAIYSVLYCVNTENTVIQNCVFVVDDGERLKRGFEIVETNTGTVLTNCTISGFSEGVVFSGTQDALVQGCSITKSNVGFYLAASQDGEPNPDFGGGARGSVGENSITDCTTCGLENETANLIYARFNTWDNDPPVEGEDYCNTGTGSVVTE